jgi:hypothetical protein
MHHSSAETKQGILDVRLQYKTRKGCKNPLFLSVCPNYIFIVAELVGESIIPLANIHVHASARVLG